MEADILGAAYHAVGIILDPTRMLYLFIGVMLGLVIGIIPGLGGIVGLSLLLPFTFKMDPYTAIAIMMGLAAAVSHGDMIPAILFGVPGTVGCAATVMDGLPMTRRGEAGRALGAAFCASLLGGLFGAVLLGVTIPIIRPFVLLVGSPELLSICVFGLTLVASLSGNAPIKGLTAGCVGLMLAMIGDDPQTGTLRYTFDTLYLWEGMHIVPVALGLFAVPELADLAINRLSISSNSKIDAHAGQWQGWKDAFQNWWLVLRCSWLGAMLAACPGIGASVIDWIAYGHAARTVKGGMETFGKGDVRGIIAAEASTNSREGGALTPTIAFGVPGHPSMAILLGAFLIQGIVPGPEMLSKRLDVTYTIVWSLTLANVLGTLICFIFANQFAKVAMVRAGVLVPLVLSMVFIGAFEGTHDWGDIWVLLGVGALAWIMKRNGWPRPPFILGFILGGLVERYMFISVERYGWSWLTNPMVMVMLALAFWGIGIPIIKTFRRPKGGVRTVDWAHPTFKWSTLFIVVVLAVFIFAFQQAAAWPFGARLMPQVVTGSGIVFSLWVLVTDLVRVPQPVGPETEDVVAAATHGVAMDIMAGYHGLATRVINLRALEYAGWCLGYFALAATIGMIPATPIFLFSYMVVTGGERVRAGLIIAACAVLGYWFIFDWAMQSAWPPALLGDLFPDLRSRFGWF